MLQNKGTLAPDYPLPPSCHFFPSGPKAESLVFSAAITHEEALVKNKSIIVVVVRIDTDLATPLNCSLAAWQSLQIVYTEKIGKHNIRGL